MKTDRKPFTIKNVSKRAKDRFSKQAKSYGIEQSYFLEKILELPIMSETALRLIKKQANIRKVSETEYIDILLGLCE